MKKLYGLIVFFWCFASLIIFGQPGLYIQDPRAWRGGEGTIENASISVKPEGSFAEVSVYLTFSARGLNFNHEDSLEIVYNFNLSDLTFTDLWLWIGDDISKALILDRWTASNIYENIVKRRRDPALLTKDYYGTYVLRVYPLAGDEHRKIKMTYLIPADAKKSQINIPLPLQLLRPSFNPLQSVTVITYPDSTWKNPRIQEADKQFTIKTDSSMYEYASMEITLKPDLQTLTLSYNNPSAGGSFVGVAQTKASDYFQLNLIPTEILDLDLAKKVCAVIDYDKTNSYFTPSEVLTSMKSLLKNYLSPIDSFNIIFSTSNFIVSQNWLSADPQKIDEVFSNLQNPIRDESNLAQGLVSAIEFIHINRNEGKILLLSNSDEYDGYEKANAFLTEIKKEMEPMIPVYIADYQTDNYNYYMAGQLYYWGNTYLYTNLSRMSRGDYFNINETGYLTDLINKTGNALTGFITNFDLSTTLQDGFTFGKFTNTNIDQTIDINKPIIQIGKYSGELPLIVQISGNYNSKVFSKKIVFENAVLNNDITLEQLWAGKYISLLEKQGNYYYNDLASEIVDYSISKRVLSTFSAFLALEQNDTLQYCASCVNEGDWVVDVAEDPIKYKDTLAVDVYPNPFNSQTKIFVQLPEKYNPGQITLKIYDIVGQEVIAFDPSEFENKAEIQLTWNGKNNFGESVASGIYIFVVNTPKAVKSLKLLNFK